MGEKKGNCTNIEKQPYFSFPLLMPFSESKPRFEAFVPNLRQGGDGTLGFATVPWPSFPSPRSLPLLSTAPPISASPHFSGSSKPTPRAPLGSWSARRSSFWSPLPSSSSS